MIEIQPQYIQHPLPVQMWRNFVYWGPILKMHRTWSQFCIRDHSQLCSEEPYMVLVIKSGLADSIVRQVPYPCSISFMSL